DRDVDLRLRVREHADDLVALDAAALVDDVDRDLGADRGRLRAAAGERAGLVEDRADLDVWLALRECVCGKQRAREHKPDCGDCTLHPFLPVRPRWAGNIFSKCAEGHALLSMAAGYRSVPRFHATGAFTRVLNLQ